MKKLSNHTALKEWSTVIGSLGRGEQVILIRKGGIADPKFGLDANEFYLYPTYFHQGESDPRLSVEITHWCESVRTWTLRDIDVLHRLAPLVSIPIETLEARYRFRPDQALHIIGVRAHRLRRSVEVRFHDEYAGCLSWLSIEDEIDIEGSTAVLSEAALNAKLAAIDLLLTVAV
jgi:hypothetical protein